MLLSSRLSLVVILILGLSFAVRTQSVTGSISGVVTDANGSALPGASVTLISEQNRVSRTAVSNEEGRFSFASVQPGMYSVKIEKQGFQTLVRTSNALTASDTLALGEIALKTGNLSETVTITAEGQVIEKDSSNLTARLTADQLDLIHPTTRID